MSRKNYTVAEQFWGHVRTGPNCWEWTATKNWNGYGLMQVRNKVLRAHRVSWELHRGPIPHGMDVLHRCDNPQCTNPDHLFLGGASDNGIDAARKGRIWRKLSVENVREVLASTEPQRKLARRLGVDQAQIQRIRARKNWAWVT